MTQAVRIDLSELRRLRRDLKQVVPEVRKSLDRELRTTALSVARIARSLSVRKTGKFAAAWKPSVTAGKGVIIRNAAVQARQQEYGAQIWLRRGLPYSPGAGGGPTSVGSLPIRQARLANGKVQNEARYLIRRSAPGRRAVSQELPRSLARIEVAVQRAAEDALS